MTSQRVPPELDLPNRDPPRTLTPRPPMARAQTPACRWSAGRVLPRARVDFTTSTGVGEQKSLHLLPPARSCDAGAGAAADVAEGGGEGGVASAAAPGWPAGAAAAGACAGVSVCGEGDSCPCTDAPLLSVPSPSAWPLPDARSPVLSFPPPGAGLAEPLAPPAGAPLPAARESPLMTLARRRESQAGR
jgi:hypothetical protein